MLILTVLLSIVTLCNLDLYIDHQFAKSQHVRNRNNVLILTVLSSIMTLCNLDVHRVHQVEEVAALHVPSALLVPSAQASGRGP